MPIDGLFYENITGNNSFREMGKQVTHACIKLFILAAATSVVQIPMLFMWNLLGKRKLPNVLPLREKIHENNVIMV